MLGTADPRREAEVEQARAVFKTGSGQLEVAFTLRDAPQPDLVENNGRRLDSSDKDFAQAWRFVASSLLTTSPSAILVGAWERDRSMKEGKVPFQDPSEHPVFTLNADGTGLGCLTQVVAETVVRYTTPPVKPNRECNRAGNSCRIGRDCCSGSCRESQCFDPMEGLKSMTLSWSDDEVPLFWGRPPSTGKVLLKGDK